MNIRFINLIYFRKTFHDADHKLSISTVISRHLNAQRIHEHVIESVGEQRLLVAPAKTPSEQLNF